MHAHVPQHNNMAPHSLLCHPQAIPVVAMASLVLVAFHTSQEISQSERMEGDAHNTLSQQSEKGPRPAPKTDTRAHPQTQIRLPAPVANALPVFRSDAIGDVVRFFNETGAHTTFRVYIDDTCWPMFEPSYDRAFSRSWIKDTLTTSRGGSSGLTDAYTRFGNNATWLDAWVFPLQSVFTKSTDRTHDTGGDKPNIDAMLPYCDNVQTLSPIEDRDNPRPGFFRTWHQKFAAEAYVPALVAQSQWVTTERSEASAAIVVAWLTCFGATDKNRQQCHHKRHTTDIKSKTLPTFSIETHDFANCYWEAERYI